MPFIPLNTFEPTAPIAGCTNAENDEREHMLLTIGGASPASLMLANMALDYPTPDEAQVVMLENALIVNGADITPEVAATLGREPQTTPLLLEQARDQRARDWLATLPAVQV